MRAPGCLWEQMVDAVLPLRSQADAQGGTRTKGLQGAVLHLGCRCGAQPAGLRCRAALGEAGEVGPAAVPWRPGSVRAPFVGTDTQQSLWKAGGQFYVPVEPCPLSWWR